MSRITPYSPDNKPNNMRKPYTIESYKAGKTPECRWPTFVILDFEADLLNSEKPFKGIVEKPLDVDGMEWTSQGLAAGRLAPASIYDLFEKEED